MCLVMVIFAVVDTLVLWCSTFNVVYVSLPCMAVEELANSLSFVLVIVPGL